jgi:rhodanese-related sulfurtransferase
MNVLRRILSPNERTTPGVRATTAQEAARLVNDGEAVLVDVREPNEWKEGVAAPAHLLPMSDLAGKRELWSVFLAQQKDRELILYCLSGGRSGSAARLLSSEGHRTANMGGFAAWRSAMLPVRKP